MPLIIEAFNQMPDKRLVVIGDGPDFGRCRELARSNVEVMGYQPFGRLHDAMRLAKAFIFAAEEDFGIVPVEAQACGTPVIAYAKGGSLETIRGLDSANPTGVFFRKQEASSIVEAVGLFERDEHAISGRSCRENAMRFSIERFRQSFTDLVNKEWERFAESRRLQ
jgi:glycosyltransferase involved in cell wall biosynthesis